MLAERLPRLLPPLDEHAALVVTVMHSVAGTLPPGAPLVTRPTFEAPHHRFENQPAVGSGPHHSASERAHTAARRSARAPERHRAVDLELPRPRAAGPLRAPDRVTVCLRRITAIVAAALVLNSVLRGRRRETLSDD
jgi:magnesium chelatase family protein